MRFGRVTRQRHETSTGLTPFVDVIFLLVLFFVFSLKFVMDERYLHAFLPKDRGPNDTETVVDLLDLLRDTSIDLEWEDAMGQRVRCGTRDYLPPSGGDRVPYWYFPDDPGVRVVRGTGGEERWETVTRLARPDGTGSDPVVFDYAAPDFRAVEAYVIRRRAELEAMGVAAGPRVTIYPDSGVPWQMVVSVIDILTRQGVEEFAVSAPEIEAP